MAIAVFVIALLLGSVLVPLQTQIETRRLEETRRLLDQARDALLGYVSAYGYFPCPASSTSNGQEDVTSHATGACAASVTGTNAYVGFLPAVTIGFTPVDIAGYALDGWGLPQNRIRYAVANATVNGVANPFTRTNGMRNAAMSNIAASTQLLYVCRTGSGVTATGCAATSDQLADDAIAVIWSLGPNAVTGGSSPHEDKNLDGNRVFVMRSQSNVAGALFDDVVTWIAPPILFNRMVAAGQLP
jgi:type II secretory pathway pseudopilin PulG